MITQTAQAKTYQYSLIHLMPAKQSLRLVNNFNRNLTKKRIVMMNKANTNRFIGWVKVLLILPLLGMMLLAFTDPDKTVDSGIKKDTSTTINNIQELRTHLARNVKYPIEAQQAGHQGEVIAHIHVDNKGRPGKPVIGKARGNNIVKVDEVVVVSYSKAGQSILSSESKENSSQKVFDRETERLLSTLPTIKIVNLIGKTLEVKLNFELQENPNKDKALFFIDDEEVPEKVVELLDTDRIQSMNVLKGEDAIAKYGDRASGGVIEISAKEKSQEASNIIIKGNGGKNSPLFIVNGTEMNDISNINKNEIASIEVLKDKNATDVYGSKGKNGVVIVSLKGDELSSGTKEILLKPTDGLDSNQVKVKSKGGIKLDLLSGENQPLYVIGDKPLSEYDVKELDSNAIESITVLKDQTAIDTYGEKAKNGVIIIELKE